MNNENETITMPRYLLRTLTPQGYFNRFYELVGASALSHVAAYQAIEDERHAFDLPPGYRGYEVFKSAKSRFFSNRLVRIAE